MIVTAWEPPLLLPSSLPWYICTEHELLSLVMLDPLLSSLPEIEYRSIGELIEREGPLARLLKGR
jgi:hypothetical protein